MQRISLFNFNTYLLMEVPNHDVEQLIDWLTQVTKRLIGRCQTTIVVSPNGCVLFSAANNVSMSSWNIDAGLDENGVEIAKNNIRSLLGV